MTSTPGRSRRRRAFGFLVTALAALLVWVALVAPTPTVGWSPTPLDLLRVPVEGIVLVAGLLALRGRATWWFAGVVGVLLGLLLVLRVLNAAFLDTVYRPFYPVTDWRYAGSFKDLISDSTGPVAAALAAAGAAALLIGLLVLTPLALHRLGRLVEQHSRGALRAVMVATVLWAACASLGVHVSPALPVASSSAVALGRETATAVRDGLHDRDVFGAQIPLDAFGGTRQGNLLSALAGKDVVVLFVESYGKVAVDGSPDVAAALTSGTTRLQDAGYSLRSAWLTSPTFGGVSWLAHSTLQSGLWVDSQQRYDQLLDTAASGSPRLTLARAFHGAGWRTVDVIPANRRDWPEGKAFYGYDRVYDARTLGYAGPGFGYAPMPDQYTLSSLDRTELGHGPAAGRPPVLAEVDLVTSHVPWAPLPRLVDWATIGDGSTFSAQVGHSTTRETVWTSPDRVRTAYGQTVAYSLDSVVSFLTSTHDDNLVVLMLGDHQPVSIVSGDHASHDVPVSIVARDPAVLRRVAGWGWQDGLRPDHAAPLWRMDQFRDRFLTAFSPSGSG